MRRRSSTRRYAAAIYAAFVSVLAAQQFGTSLAPIILALAIAVDAVNVFGNRNRRLPVNTGALVLTGIMLGWVVIILMTRSGAIGVFGLPLSILAAIVAATLHGPYTSDDELVMARALVWGGVAVAVA